MLSLQLQTDPCKIIIHLQINEAYGKRTLLMNEKLYVFLIPKKEVVVKKRKPSVQQPIELFESCLMKFL